MLSRSCLILLLCITFCCRLAAQTIKGEVIDMETRQPVDGVSIQNVYTNLGISSSSDGHFFIGAANDQLLEFSKPGYQTVHVRVPKGFIPPYFKIIMQKGVPPVPLLDVHNEHSFRGDSIRYAELYKPELEFGRMSTLDKIEHPFSALSKQSQQIWKFQDNYEENQQQRYIDYTFNAELVGRITGLSGDELSRYMRRYRPTYRLLRSMNEYTLYNYIKVTGHRFHLSNGGTDRSSR